MKDAYCHSLNRVISVTEAMEIFSGREKEYKHDFACQYCMIPMLCANIDNKEPIVPPYFKTRNNIDHKPNCKYELKKQNKTGSSSNLTGEYQPLSNSRKEIFRISLSPEPAPSSSGAEVNYKGSCSSSEQTFTRATPVTPTIGTVHDLLLRAARYERDGTFSERSVIIGGEEIPYRSLISESCFKQFTTEKPQLFIGWSEVTHNNTAGKIIFSFTENPIFDGTKKSLTAIIERATIDEAAMLSPKLIEDLAKIEKNRYAHTAIFGTPRMTRKTDNNSFILYVKDMKEIFFSPTHLPPRAVHTRMNPKSLKNPPHKN